MSPRLAGVLFLLLFTTLHPTLAAEDRPVHLSSIPDQATFTAYGEILDAQEWGKFVVDLKELRIYYFDVKLFPLHRDFVFSEILPEIPARASVHEYNKNYGYQKPRLYHTGRRDHHSDVVYAAFARQPAGPRLAHSQRNVSRCRQALRFPGGQTGDDGGAGSDVHAA
jgi:hypothetical protein